MSIKIGIEGLKISLEHDAEALNLAIVKEADAIADRKSKQVAYDNSLSAFHIGVQETLAATAVVRKVD
jgi:hypothetical protein